MRYLVQFLIPALIFAGVVYLFMRNRRHSEPGTAQESSAKGSETGVFIAILALGAIVALGTAFALQSLWE